MAVPEADRHLPVIVMHAVPGYRLGLLAALSDAGFDTFDPENPAAWAVEHAPCALLVRTEDSEDLAALEDAHGRKENVIVALLSEDDPQAYALALRAGADGAVPWDSPPGTIVGVTAAALSGN